MHQHPKPSTHPSANDLASYVIGKKESLVTQEVAGPCRYQHHFHIIVIYVPD